MPRYYFHFENGEILHDDTGVELPELPPPRTKLCEELAILCGGGRLTASFWDGTPWRMWVTDKPNGEGKTFFTLRCAAEK